MPSSAENEKRLEEASAMLANAAFELQALVQKVSEALVIAKEDVDPDKNKRKNKK
jgi:hypothetical protein